MTALEGWSPAGLPELAPGHAKAPVQSEGLAISQLPEDHAKATPHPSLIVPLPSRGTGRLAGVTKVEGVPQGGAWVRVLYRPAKGTLSDGAVVADVISANDGTWEVTNLNLSLRYDVVCRMAGRKDQVIPSVAPVPMPLAVAGTLAPSLGVWDGIIQARLLGMLVISGGRPPYSAAVSAGSLPPGVTLQVTGELVFTPGSWRPNTDYSYPFTLMVTDADGVTVSKVLLVAGREVLSFGLLAWYKMDSISGGVLIDELGGNNGTIVNAELVGGRAGGAIQFNGTDSIGNIPHNPALDVLVFSVSVWVKFTGDLNLVIAEKNGNAGWSLQTITSAIALSAGGGLAGQVIMVVGGTASGLRSGVSINDGMWHHVVAAIDYVGGSTKIYVDGAATSPTSGPGSRPGGNPGYVAGPLSIGARPPALGPFTGAIDNFRYYNRVLSAAEVFTLFNE